jgi:hypothetical protein
MLASFGPLLPGAPDKRPLVGDGWENHAGVPVAELQTTAPECVCWHIGAAPSHIAIDIDGPRAAAFCQQHGCDPYTADTWRIVRTGNSDRLKLVYTVTAEQKAILAAGGKTVKVGISEGGPDDKGEEFAVFAKHGTQVVVLGQHYTKESHFTDNDDQYAWAGRPPADAHTRAAQLQQRIRHLAQQQPAAAMPDVRPRPLRRLQHPSGRRFGLVLPRRDEISP